MSNYEPNRVGAKSDQGPVRPANEDHFWVTNSQMPNHLGALYIVADGVGGQEHGAAASQMATKVISTSFYAARENGASIVNSLADAIMDANEAIYTDSQRRGPGKMGSTLVTAVQHDGRLIIAHIGDARAYLLQGRKLRRLTKDDTWVQKQVDAGIITKEAAAKHELRNVVTQVLGNKPEINVHISEPQEVSSSDILLLCSDGVHDVIENADLYRTLKDLTPQQAAESLVQQAIANGTRDNVTAVVVRTGSRPDPDDTAKEPRLALGALQKKEPDATFSEPAKTAALASPIDATLQEPGLANATASGKAPAGGLPRWAIFAIIGVVMLAILFVLGMLILNSDNIGIRLSSNAESDGAAGGDSTASVEEAPGESDTVVVVATNTVETIVITPTPLPPTETAVPPTAAPTVPPLPTSTPIPVVTAAETAVQPTGSSPGQRACIDGGAYLWPDSQAGAPDCDANSERLLQDNAEVIILPEPMQIILGPGRTSADDCLSLEMRRIQTVEEPIQTGWVISGTLEILPPGAICQP